MTDFSRDSVNAVLCDRAERQLDTAVQYLDRGDPEMARAHLGALRCTLELIRAGEPERPFRKLALVQAPPKEPPALTAKEEREAEIEKAYLDATDEIRAELRDPDDEPEEEEPPRRRSEQYDGPPEDDINF